MNLSLETADGAMRRETFAPSAMPPAKSARRRANAGIAAHRAPFAARLVEALATRYPVVCRLAGAESFHAIAHRFVLARRPCSPALTRHAETFPEFLRSLGHAASISYLADVAELEMLCARACRAAYAAPMASSSFASLPQQRLADLGVVLHPSVGLLASRFPVVTVWEANRDVSDAFVIRQWVAEQALVARPFRKVEVRRLAAGGLPFLAALRAGATISAAAEVASSAAADFVLGTHLALLNELDIVVGFHSGVGEAPRRMHQCTLLPESALERPAMKR
jgi:hypothetical protein